MPVVKSLDFGYGPSNENVFAVTPTQWINNYALVAGTPKALAISLQVGRIFVLSWPSAVDLYWAWQNSQPTWPVVADNVLGSGWGINPGPFYIKEADQVNLWIATTVDCIVAAAIYKRTS